MLSEFKSVKQHEGEPLRRWFEDDFFDLIVWYADGDSRNDDGNRNIYGFQLCYDKKGRERAVTWLETTGYSHEIIDSGQTSAWDVRSPVLSGAAAFPREHVIECFTERSAEIETHIARCVLQKLADYSSTNELQKNIG